MALPKPNPSTYRGGSTSGTYKQDLLNWENSQQPAVAPMVEPVGREEIVSLASAFDQPENDVFALDSAPTVDNYGAGSGYRGEPTTVAPVAPVAPVVSSDPFADFSRISAGGKDITAEYSDDPSTYEDTLTAGDIPYMQYSDEALANVNFMTPTDEQFTGNTFGGRLISGDTEEYDTTYSYNNMLSRGIDEQTAQDWLNKGGTAQEANDIIADKFLNQKEQFTAALDTFKEQGNVGEFTNQWKQTDFGGKVAYLNNLQESGELDKETYEKAWRDEWNLSQRDNPRPTYIVEMQAPRDWDEGDSIYNPEGTKKYKAGDTIYVTYQPEGIDPANNLGVLQDSSYYPNTNTKGLELQYYDNVGPKTTNLSPPSQWMSFREEFLKPGLRMTLAALSGGMSEAAYVAARGLSGETLKGEDWATLAMAGANLSGLTSPPTEVNPAGVGIGGLSYGQTQGLINAVGTGDPTDYLISEFGGDIINKTLDKLGINSKNLSPEVLSGIGRTVDKLLLGEDFDDAVESGVGEWARESGIGDELEGTLRTVGRDFDKKYLQPLKEALPEGVDFPDTPEGIKGIEDTAKKIASGVADAAEPFKDPLQDVGRFIDDKLLQPAKDALLDAGSAMLTGTASRQGTVSRQAPSKTRTTDSLFSSELFQFSPVEFTNVERTAIPEQTAQVADKEEEVVDLFSSPFTSSLDRYTV
jgi:hypothetical protein